MQKWPFSDEGLFYGLQQVMGHSDMKVSLTVRLQRSWTLMFGVIYKKIADLVLR